MGHVRRVRWLIPIVLLGAIVRLAFVIGWTIHEPLEGDAVIYHSQANNLADGHPWVDPWRLGLLGESVPQADHPPAFVAYLGIFSLIGLRSDGAHLVASAIPGIVLVAIVALLAEELAGRRAGVIAGVIAAIDPNLWTWDGRVLSEPLAALFLTTSILLGYQASRDPTSRRFVAAVAVGVLAGLTRAELMLVVPAIVIVVGHQLWAVVSRRQFLITMGIAVAVSGLLVLPWAVWNTARYDRPVLISTGLGRALASGTCDAGFYGPHRGLWDITCLDAISQAHPDATDAALDVLWRDASLAYAREHARDVPAVIAARLGRVMGIYRPGEQLRFEQVADGRRAPVVGIELVGFWFLAVAFVVGLRGLRRRQRSVALALAPVGAVAAGVIIAFGSWRYRAALEGIIAAVAAVGIIGVIEALERRRGARLSWITIAVGGATVIGLIAAVGIAVGLASNVA